MRLSLSTNAGELARLYEKRANALRNAASLPRIMAMETKRIRLKKMDEMIYQESRYIGTSRAPTGELRAAERVTGDMVYNVSEYANVLLQKKNWASAAFQESLIGHRRKTMQVQRNMLMGM